MHIFSMCGYICLYQGRQAALPEGVAAIHKLVGPALEATFHLSLAGTTCERGR